MCGVVSLGAGSVVWVLEVGEEEADDVVWEGGTSRVTLLVLDVMSVSVSVSSVLSVSVVLLFLRVALIAASLATASLMWVGTRTQANVRS